jgi:hypothetical protein
MEAEMMDARHAKVLTAIGGDVPSGGGSGTRLRSGTGPASRWRHCAALLALLVIPFTGVYQQYAMLLCQNHHSNHHHDAGQSTPEHQHAGDQGSCNCQSLCQSTVVLPAPSPAVRSTELSERIHATAGSRDAARVANRETHLLPFSTAPPSPV